MKILLTSLILSFFALSSDISKAIQNSDANQLSSFFNATVELDILGEEASYSQTQAAQVIKRFFTNYPVDSYKVIHTGKAKDGSSFQIGSLISRGGEFRTHLLLKGNGVNQKIHEFRVEAENE